MVLHLAHHKSYHPYNAANIARVKADEAAAELEQASQAERSSMADSEARIEALRKRAGLSATVAAGNKKRKRGAEDDAEQALNQQLQPKGWASSSKQQPESESRATIVRPEQQSPSADESHELNGHINFWADYENGRKLPGASKLKAEKANTKSKEQEEWEERHTMYLSKPCPELQPWYGQRDLRSGSSKKRSEDQVLEDTFKDSELKRTHDPLVSVEWFLKKKQQAPDKRSRWEETPRVEDRDRGPPILKARSKRGEMPAWKKAAEEQSAPPPPPPSASTSNTSSKTQSLESSTKSRENSERARAQALKAEARRRRDASSSVASTPASEGGYHSGYNKHVTKGLHRERGHGWKNARWDDR